MTPQVFLGAIISPAARLLPEHDSPEARCLLLAIAGQESGWAQRLQEPIPFARGFWQCEKNGAVVAVLTSEATRTLIVQICTALCIPPGLDQVFEAIAWNDALACCVARLNLVLDPAGLPAIGERETAWETYLRVWRPGKPSPDRWLTCYDAAAACFDRAADPVGAAA